MFLDLFWQRYPALLYGFVTLLGCFFALSPNAALLLPVALIFFSLISDPKRLLLSLLLFLAICTNIHFRYLFPEGELEGAALFEIESLKHSHNSFGKQWHYKGTVRTFVKGETLLAKAVPCRLILRDTSEKRRPPADCAYLVQGHLKRLERGGYLLKVSLDEPWKPIRGSWSLAEWRFYAKSHFSSFLQKQIPDRRSAVFLTGILTGEFDDRLMLYEFGRFGLQHILAISGFHFAILAGIFSLLLRLCVSRKKGVVILIICLSAYFLFLGMNPSVMRAFIAAIITLAGGLNNRQASGINALGIGMMAILLYDPLLCLHIGFQFSFAATAAILLLFSPCDQVLQLLFPKRPLYVALQMDRWNQKGFVVLTMARQAISLGIAVHLVTLPMMLAHFHRFPWMSLLYNLFFPAMVGWAMFLLILSILVGLVVPADWLHLANSHFTKFLLDFTYNIPPGLDLVLRVEEFRHEWVLVLLSGLFYLIALHRVKELAAQKGV